MCRVSLIREKTYKTYNTLLFDIDDTLLDFGAAENVSEDT